MHYRYIRKLKTAKRMYNLSKVVNSNMIYKLTGNTQIKSKITFLVLFICARLIRKHRKAFKCQTIKVNMFIFESNTVRKSFTIISHALVTEISNKKTSSHCHPLGNLRHLHNSKRNQTSSKVQRESSSNKCY